MYEIQNIAKKLFTIDENIECKCEAEHQLCLSCTKCRAENPDNYQLSTTTVNANNDSPLPLNTYIDHTILKPDATTQEVIDLCYQANTHQFKSVCINPVHIPTAKAHITTPLICTVVGFPLGANTTITKLIETQQALEAGASEIDMVINIGKLKEITLCSDINTAVSGIKQPTRAKNLSPLQDIVKIIYDDISTLANACHQQNAILKVIIETCLLTRDEIVIACLIAKKAGADFVKTSTGFSIKGAVAENVKLMRAIVGAYMGVKASGGIRTRDEAIAMLSAGANRLGTSNSVKIVTSE